VPYGEYTATVSLDGYITNQATIGVTYNNVQAENLFLVYNGSSNGGNGSNSSNGGESGENGSGSGNETQATGSVSGTVINATTGNALSGVVLTVYVRSGSGNTEGEVVYQTTTGTNGSYTLSSLPAGNYTLQFVDEREGISDAARYSTTTQNVAVLPDSTVSGQRVTVSNSLSVDSIRVVLTWGSTPNDLDSHLVISGSGTSYHIYYGDKSPSGADASLDVDDTTSYGPETITITAIKSGATYYYYVYNYSGGDYALANSNAKVTVYIGNEVFTLSVPSGSGLYWNVFSYNSDTGLVIVNQVSLHALA
jgi:hypothetical protein